MPFSLTGNGVCKGIGKEMGDWSVGPTFPLPPEGMSPISPMSKSPSPISRGSGSGYSPFKSALYRSLICAFIFSSCS
eukprot:24143_4